MKKFMKNLWYILSLWYMMVPIFGMEPWTWYYQKMYTAHTMKSNVDKATLVFEQPKTPAFTQLIFSWNAFRPKGGFLRFRVQVRDAKTHKWNMVYTMYDWGVQVQKSYKYKTDDSSYHHVRLELASQKKADAFRILVEPHEAATLTGVRALFVCISDFTRFTTEKMDPTFQQLSPVFLDGVPLQSQMVLDHPKKEVLCSPTSCTVLTSYLLKKQLDPILFAERSYDSGLEAYGSWPFNIAHAFEQAQGTSFFCVRRLPSFKTLHQLLCKNTPVVVSVRGAINGAPQEYENGHLLVVVGWDPHKQQVICHDPAFESTEKTRVAYHIKSFLPAWERSRRLAYCAFLNV